MNNTSIENVLWLRPAAVWTLLALSLWFITPVGVKAQNRQLV
ncbi:MAG: hypothetical protein ACR2MG_01995 [Pyrinomonadaceae bacterium]